MPSSRGSSSSFSSPSFGAAAGRLGAVARTRCRPSARRRRPADRARGRGLTAPSRFAAMCGRIARPSPPKITGTTSASSAAVVLDLEACPRRSRSRASCRRDLPLDFVRSAPKRRGASAYRAFSGGQLPSSRGRDRQPRWPTGCRSPGTAAAPRAPRTTTATARTARAAAASPMMMAATARERRTAARITDVPATRPRVASCATNVTGRTAAERPSAPGGDTDDRRRHRGASRGGGAAREDTRAVAPSRGNVWPW